VQPVNPRPAQYLDRPTRRSGLKLSLRAQRSNPFFLDVDKMDCFAALAMTLGGEAPQVQIKKVFLLLFLQKRSAFY
jgi:hypothetical protein